MDVLAFQFNVTVCCTGEAGTTPEPVRASESTDALLVESVSVPLEAPELVGAKTTCNVTLAPPLTEIGNDVAANRNPAPFRLADSIVPGALPVSVMVTDCFADVSTVTSPKDSDFGLMLHAAFDWLVGAGAVVVVVDVVDGGGVVDAGAVVAGGVVGVVVDDVVGAAGTGDVCVDMAGVAAGIPAQPNVSKSQTHEPRKRAKSFVRTHAPFRCHSAAHPG